MSDIKIKIKNYKLVKEFESEHPDARLLLVTGKNEIGKTSLIRAFIESMTAKAVTDDPVSLGEQSGSTTFNFPDKDGNPIVVHHDFSLENKQGSFYAIDHLGKKVSSPVKMRELIGYFEELPVDKFFNMVQSAEGRRKIIDNYIYPLLSGENVERIKFLDKETKKGGEAYDERTQVNTEIKFFENQLKGSVLTEQDKVLAKEYGNIVENLGVLEKEKESLRDKSQALSNLNYRLEQVNASIENTTNSIAEAQAEEIELNKEIDDEIAELEAKIVKLKEKKVATSESTNVKLNELGSKEKELYATRKNIMENLEDYKDDTRLTTIDTEIEEAKSYRDKALEAVNKKKNYDTSFAEIQKKYEVVAELNKKIEEYREEKASIIANSNLPAGLSIDGDNFTWNGFTFSDAQISKSSALLVIAEILCNVVQAKIVYIGEKALFDKGRYEQLVEMANKYGKIPVLEQVVSEQDDIKVITEINE